MLKKRDAQGLSINVIIIAVIALVVLIVLVAIFTDRLGIFSRGVSELETCKGLGGECKVACGVDEERVFGALDCDRDYDGDGEIDNKDKPICCKKK